YKNLKKRQISLKTKKRKLHNDHQNVENQFWIFFVKIDVRVELKEKSFPLTAYGHIKFLSIPLDLKNAPANLDQSCLKKILIYGKSFELDNPRAYNFFDIKPDPSWHLEVDDQFKISFQFKKLSFISKETAVERLIPKNGLIVSSN
ncbi:hypothetical protein BpHYR1_047428, partial [Brachionus plicatilis]